MSSLLLPIISRGGILLNRTITIDQFSTVAGYSDSAGVGTVSNDTFNGKHIHLITCGISGGAESTFIEFNDNTLPQTFFSFLYLEAGDGEIYVLSSASASYNTVVSPAGKRWSWVGNPNTGSISGPWNIADDGTTRRWGIK